MKRLLVILGVTGLVLAACGSSGKKTTSTTAASAGETTTVKFSGSSSSNFCELARRVTASAQPTGSSTDQVKASVRQFNSVKAQVEANAPAAIKADVHEVITVVSQVFDALTNANYDYSKLPPSALQSFQSPAFTGAAQRLTAYVTQVCGVSTPTTG